MNRPVPEIPGYFFDKAKNKYFKMQDSTAPSSAAYSPEDVKNRQAHDRHEDQQAQQVKKAVGRIRRFADLENTLSGFVMKREFGQTPDLDSVRCILAAGLSDRTIYNSMTWGGWMGQSLFCLRPCLDRTDSVVELHQARGGRVHSTLALFNETRGAQIGRSQEIEFYGGAQAHTTSISCHDTEGFLATTFISGLTERAIGIWRGLSDEPTMIFGPGTAKGNQVDVNYSTAAPPDSSLLFAFGAKGGILTLDKERQDLTWLKDEDVPCSSTKKSVLSDDFTALEFLSAPKSGQAPFTLLAGARSGSVRRFDLRAPVVPEFTPLITHASLVQHIKQIDEHHIIVVGMQSNLRQYDMRYLRLVDDDIGAWPRKRVTMTTPCVRYDEYVNESSYHVGFDIDTESGLVATSQSGRHPDVASVQLFSLHGGNQVRAPIPSREIQAPDITDERFESLIGPWSIQFVQDMEGSMKSLYVSDSNEHMIRYGWSNTDEEERGLGKKWLKEIQPEDIEDDYY